MIRRLPVISLLAIFSFCYSASLLSDPYAEDRQSLLEKLDIVESGLNEQNIDKIVPLLKDDVVVSFINAEVTRNIPDLLAYYEKVVGGSSAMLESYSTKAELAAPARFYGNVAVADGSTLDTYTFPTGEVVVMKTIWSTVLVKEDNDWKVSQLHFSANPFNNPIIESLKGNIKVIAFIGLLVCLALGFAVGRITKKNAKA